ncbi:hypothetical protein Glove_350g46 [Diversispora epigaea]|uniref:Nudix hydrolase domain-containing protein n=1 Tax=Diversispora epigaea TaxID=1348612 RepID=A0A397HD14_9GLOM|nr:hypothetical protein Glove_350g46 [Diversispora epigaea]
MSRFEESTVLNRLRIALSNLEKIPAHKLPSPPHQKRRASVAIIIRIRPLSKSHYHYNEETNIDNSDEELSSSENDIISIDDFWTLPWVNDGIPEILYIRRALREGDRWSGQMAFPGGKQDPEDVDDLDTAERETFEEVGFDLGNNKLFMNVGALDDLEVTTTFGKTLLMVLCPFVFIQLTRESPKIEISGSEVASTHWIPISVFFDPKLSQKFNPISIDLSPRLAPQSWILQNVLKTLIGRMHFHCIDLPQSNLTTTGSLETSSSDGLLIIESTTTVELDPKKKISSSSSPPPPPPPPEFHNTTLRLWGLTLQMTSDLMDMMYRPDEEPPRRLDASRPKFDYWDVNFFIWLFLKNNRVFYRRYLTDFVNRRTKWASGWNDFHKAVQKSIIIAIITRTSIAILVLYRSPKIIKYLIYLMKVKLLSKERNKCKEYGIVRR